MDIDVLGLTPISEFTLSLCETVNASITYIFLTIQYKYTLSLNERLSALSQTSLINIPIPPPNSKIMCNYETTFYHRTSQHSLMDLRSRVLRGDIGIDSTSVRHSNRILIHLSASDVILSDMRALKIIGINGCLQ